MWLMQNENSILQILPILLTKFTIIPIGDWSSVGRGYCQPDIYYWISVNAIWLSDVIQLSETKAIVYSSDNYEEIRPMLKFLLSLKGSSDKGNGQPQQVKSIFDYPKPSRGKPGKVNWLIEVVPMLNIDVWIEVIKMSSLCKTS